MTELGGAVDTTLVLVVIVAMGSWVAAAAGFGFALVTTPLLVLFMAPQRAVPLIMLCWIPLMLLLVRDSWKLANWRRYGLLAAAGALGTPIGVWILAALDATAARRGIGCLTLVAAASMWLRPARPWRREKIATAGAGFIGGIMAGISGMSGPPVVLLGLNQGWEHQKFRADLIFFFAINYLTALYWFNNRLGFTVEDAQLAGWAVGGVVIGYLAGSWGRRYISPTVFRRLALGLVSGGGLLALLAPANG